MSSAAIKGIIALAGRPNTGKTTLFNALTGHNQRIGNFSGTTVEKASGELRLNDASEIQLIDLPGTTTPLPLTRDQQVSIDFIDGEIDKAIRADPKTPFGIFWVAEASNLELDLPFALFFHRLGYPVTLVVNMIDEAERNGLSIDLPALERELGMRVIATSGRTEVGIDALKHAIAALAHTTVHVHPKIPVSKLPEDTLCLTHSDTIQAARAIAERVTTGHAPGTVLPQVKHALALDRFFLHPIAGPLFFLAVMVALFNAIFTWAAPITDLIDIGISAISEWTRANVHHAMLASLLVDGVIAGLAAVFAFIPQIAILFLLIGFLEKTGYLPRAAALMDRLMRPFGLDGKVFIPLLSSFACAIPGIMATRTLEAEKRRITTILIAPLMTCSARLPVYTLLISAFIPAKWRVLGLSAQGLTMVAMYGLAILFAMIVAFVIKQTSLHVRGGSQYILFPPFRMPRFQELLQFTGQRCALFMRRAGKVIFVLSIVLWFLASFPRVETLSPSSSVTPLTQIEQSYLGTIGKAVQPVFAPLGYDWRLSIGLMTAFAAREVFVSTLGTIFAVGDTGGEETPFNLIDRLQNAKTQTGDAAYTLATAISLLLFFAIALQCMSTVAVTHRETGGWKWPAVQLAYLWTLAYAMAFLGYQVTTWVMG